MNLDKARKAMLTALLIGQLGNALWAVDGPRQDKKTMLASVDLDGLLHSTRVEPPKEEPKVVVKPKKPVVEIDRGPALKVKIDEKMVIDSIRHQLADQFGVTQDMRVYFDRPWKAIDVDQGHWEIAVTSFPSQGLRSRFYLNFELWSGGSRVGSWQEGVRCELWMEAYVANQRVNRGDVFNEGMFSLQPVDVLGLYQTPVDLGTPLNEYIAANGVKAGDPLYWRDLKERPLVRRNQIVEVVAREGWMKISLKGKALEDGVKGQVIRVRNLQSYRDIQAEVVGVSKARVYF
ncbi:MAG: flagellar basal body P-ring formation chaperone FlgA [Opitutales bacterium]|nr:flagellar basal body P-ring formation chaperone FlgA [Opitutales bacterium]